MQAWTVPPLNPPAEVRLQDNLQRKGLAPAPRHDGVPSATVEVLGRVDGKEEQLQAFRDWLHKDLQLALQSPPASLQAMELNAFMMGNPSDPAAILRTVVLDTRGWYQAPLQVEALERARVDALYK